MARRRAPDRIDLDAVRWTLAYRRAKTAAAELDLRERREGLIRCADVAAMLADREATIRAALLALAQRVAMQCDVSIRAGVLDEIAREVREIVDRYARPLPHDDATPDSRGGRRRTAPPRAAGGAR
jgi:hypothetical protein